MSSIQQKLAWAATAGAILSAVAFLVFLCLPTLLASHERAVKRVIANFKTPEEAKQKTAEAKALDDPVFETLYKPQGSEKIAVYLAPRGSFAYGILSSFAVALRVEKPVAALEDLLPAPPAPEAGVYLNENNVYTMQLSAVAFFVRIFRIAFALAAVVLAVLAYLLGKAARTQAA